MAKKNGFSVADLIAALEKIEDKNASLTVEAQLDNLKITGTIDSLDGLVIHFKDAAIRS